MRTQRSLALLVIAVVSLIVPTAAAYGNGGSENEVTQDDNNADSSQSNVLDNDVDFHVGTNGYGAWEYGSTTEGAVALTNCQLIVVGDAWVGAISVMSTLGVITDEDDTRELDAPIFPLSRGIGNLDLDAETANSTCDTSAGPIAIHVAVASDFGNPAPLGGSIAGALTAASQGGWWRDYDASHDNTITQEYLDADTYQGDVITNDAYMDVGGYGAVAISNCQGIVAAHVGVFSVAMVSSEARIRDDDTTRDVDLGAEPTAVDVELTPRTLDVEIENDSTATSSCTQTIESITISVGGSSRLPPQS